MDTTSIYSEQEEVQLEIEEGSNQPKRIETMEDAVRYAYGMAETRKEIEKLDAIALAEIEKWEQRIKEVTEWRDAVTSPLREKVHYFTLLLSDFHSREYENAEDEKAKKKVTSIKLPYGVTLKSRAQADKLEVADDVAYKQYAKENKLLKVAEPTVDWAEMKKNIIVNEDGRALNKETGEFLDFIKVVPQDRKFEVK